MGARMGLSLLALIAGALIVITAGVVCWVVVPNVIDKKIKEETRLDEGSDTWNKWENITVPIKLKFYIYNITNPDADLINEKLNFTEIGPYVYDEVRAKNVSNYDESGEKVTYKQTIHYFFNRNDSVGNETDTFNIPNVPFISVAMSGFTRYPLGDLTFQLLINLLANPVLGKQKFVQTNVTVRELLFDGWKLNAVYDRLGDQAPPDFVGGRFGLYRFKNGSSDGEYEVKTGLKDHTEFGQISKWEKKEELEWWYTKGLDKNSSKHYCNKINGSDGSIFPPFNTKDTTLRLFSTDVCRSIFMKFNSEVTYKDIPGYKYTIPMEMFEHPDKNEDNRCFCQDPSNNKTQISKDCGESVIRIFPCKHGAPIVTSNARFLDGPDVLFEPINILRPNRSLHETFIEIEPDSGMLLRASKKIQINVELQPLPKNLALFERLNFTKFTKSKSILLPIMWADESVELDDENAQDLYDKLIKPQKMVNIIRWVAIGVGAVLAVGGLIGVIKAATAK